MWCPSGPVRSASFPRGGRGHPARPGDAVDAELLCDALAGGAPLTRGDEGWTRMDGETLAALSLAVNVNEAPVEELDSLPGIGPVLAQRIVEARPFSDVDALIDGSSEATSPIEGLLERLAKDAGNDAVLKKA